VNWFYSSALHNIGFVFLCFIYQHCSKNFSHNQTFFLLCTLFQKPHLVNDLGNFEPRNVAERTGPGEGGKPHILHDEQQNDASQTLTEFGMNMVCSDEISMSRSIPDTRLPE
jgi:hypothetical protein